MEMRTGVRQVRGRPGVQVKERCWEEKRKGGRGNERGGTKGVRNKKRKEDKGNDKVEGGAKEGKENEEIEE